MILSCKTIRQHAVAAAAVMILALPLTTTAKAAIFSESQLTSFVTAVAAINEIALKWQPQVRAAETEDQAATMLQQADTEMRQAIEGTDGIELDEYQQIMEAAQTDPALKTRIDALLNDVAPQ